MNTRCCHHSQVLMLTRLLSIRRLASDPSLPGNYANYPLFEWLFNLAENGFVLSCCLGLDIILSEERLSLHIFKTLNLLTIVCRYVHLTLDLETPSVARYLTNSISRYSMLFIFLVKWHKSNPKKDHPREAKRCLQELLGHILHFFFLFAVIPFPHSDSNNIIVCNCCWQTSPLSF